jgi:hypothetical protein
MMIEAKTNPQPRKRYIIKGNWMGNTPEFDRSIGHVNRNINRMPLTRENRLRNSVSCFMENSFQTLISYRICDCLV